ncbi:MAG: elongation factor G [candidate division Zixibacteria bacterium]|nr:elongation factor G [candidate division Zixibacteria bacterium]MDH3937480.1 elongation factor G [candidate division Zixibacteria bacterium]
MKEFTTDKIRNICVAGQRGCGKTSLGDAVAFIAGINNRVGRVDDGSSLLDHTDIEMSKKTTISAKLLATPWSDNKINWLDCPGHPDFVGELLSSGAVSDAALFVINATSGVEVGTQMQWRALGDKPVARMFFVNKMEQENVTWQANLDSLNEAFGVSVAAVQMPIGEASGFKGIIDLLTNKAYTFDDKGKATETEIPGDMKDAAQAGRDKLIESAAEGDDALLEKFFEDGTLSDEDFATGFAKGLQAGKVYPILCGSASLNMGVSLLLDFINRHAPSPADMPASTALKSGTEDAVEVACDASGQPLAYVFKTLSESHLGDMSFLKIYSGTLKSGMDLKNQQTDNGERVTQIYTLQGKSRQDIASVGAGDIGLLVKLKNTHTGNSLASNALGLTVPAVAYPNPVMDVAIRAKSKGDEEKISSGLNKLHEADPTFKLVADPALAQQVLYGQGPTHIEVLTEQLKSRFGVEVELVRPKIPYRETIKGKAEKQYRHKKQSGGRGQFGDVHIRLEPNVRGGGFEFIDAIKGGVIPTKFIPAVEKGVVESMVKGGLAGSQVVDVKVTLFFGSYHDVDSSDMAFKIAGLMAFKEGFMESKPVLLEPICNIEVTVPDDYTGDVMGDLSSRRGKIAGMDPDGRNQIVRAAVPQAELYQYAVDLRSMTQGQGVYALEFARYEEVPHDAAQKVIEAAKRDAEEES